MKFTKIEKGEPKTRNVYMGASLQRLFRSRLYLRNASAVVNEAVGRYLAICDRYRPDLTEGEWQAVRESIPLDAAGIATGSVPWVCVEDAARAGMLDHLEVDAASLIERLRGLTPAEEVAVLEMVERER